MGRTGSTSTTRKLIAEVRREANNYWDIKAGVRAGEYSYESIEVSMAQMRGHLMRARKIGNFHLFSSVELALVISDYENFYEQTRDNRSKETTAIESSLEKALRQMNELAQIIGLRADDPRTYHKMAEGTRAPSIEFDGNGLPLDGVRRILRSHKTRIMNKIRGMYGDSFIEQEVMGLRRDNLLAMEKQYKQMQLEAQAVE